MICCVYDCRLGVVFVDDSDASGWAGGIIGGVVISPCAGEEGTISPL